MKLLVRYENVIDFKKDLETLYVYKKFPVFMGCVEHELGEDIKVDMEWSISKGNGIIQLCKLVPLDILYHSDHNSGVVGDLWLEHHKEFARFVNKVNPKSVLEIGGGHGILSRETKKINSIKWIIVEPNPSAAEKVEVEFIEGFFDENFFIEREIDTVVHSHVFEHVYSPDNFLTNISRFLNEGQKLVFSLPNMEEMLKRKYTNCLNFEHTFFMTEPYIEHLLSKKGFRKIEKKYFREDHSIFYSYVKDSKQKCIDLPNNLFDKNKKIFLNYLENYKKLIQNLNNKISSIPKDQQIYLFGAHIFSQYLIECGLDTSRIICLLDNDNNKHNKRLYGTNLIVQSSKILSKIDKPNVILNVGVYNSEVKNDILCNINNQTNFID